MKRLLFVVALCALRAQAQWVAGPEQILTSPATGPTRLGSWPAVAASRSNYLGVWLWTPLSDSRQPIEVLPFTAGGPQAPAQIEIGATYNIPDVASDGTDYVVAWLEEGAIRIRRLANDGTPLEAAKSIAPPQPFAQAAGTTRASFDGARYVFVADTAKTLEAAWTTPDGSTLATLTFGDGETLADAAAARGVALATTERNGVLLGRLLAPGAAAPQPFVITNELGSPFLVGAASDGTSFLVAWIDHDEVLRAARIDGAGSVATPQTLGTGVRGRPAVAWNGRDFAVSWTDATAVRFTTLRDAGAVAPLVLPAADDVALAGDGGTTALLTRQGFVLGRTISAQRAVSEPVALTRIALPQSTPHIAGNGLFWMQGGLAGPLALMRNGTVVQDDVVAYDVAPGDGGAVAVVRADRQAGIVALDSGVPVALLQPSDGRIAIASSGRTRLAAYLQGGAVWGFRVSGRGSLLDAQPILLSAGLGMASRVQAVWRDDAFVVTWVERPFSAVTLTTAKSVRVAEDGSHGAEVTVMSVPATVTFGQLATSGGVTALEWETYASGMTEVSVVRADPEVPRPSVFVTRGNFPRGIQLAGVRDGFDVVWVAPDAAHTAYRMTLSRDFGSVSAAETLGPMPVEDPTIVYGQAGPQLLLYSTGSTIAGRTFTRDLRRRASAR